MKIDILTHFWPPGVPESNSASKIIWVHRLKSIFSQNSKTQLFDKINFAYNSTLESLNQAFDRLEL